MVQTMLWSGSKALSEGGSSNIVLGHSPYTNTGTHICLKLQHIPNWVCTAWFVRKGACLEATILLTPALISLAVDKARTRGVQATRDAASAQNHTLSRDQFDMFMRREPVSPNDTVT